MERERGVKDILSKRREERRRTPGNALDAREEGKMRDNLSVHWEKWKGGRRLVEIGSLRGVSKGPRMG